MNASGRYLMPLIDAALKRGQHVRLTVNGMSMCPFLCDHDTVELAPPSALRLGDLVLAGAQGPEIRERWKLHRVVRLHRDGSFTLRGDNRSEKEGPFSPDAALGVVVDAWHHGKRRALNRGWWRIAGLLWLATAPVSRRLYQALGSLRRLAKSVVRG